VTSRATPSPVLPTWRSASSKSTRKRACEGRRAKRDHGYHPPDGGFAAPCGAQQIGTVCNTNGQKCDPASDCDSLLVCAATDPKMSPECSDPLPLHLQRCHRQTRVAVEIDSVMVGIDCRALFEPLSRRVGLASVAPCGKGQRLDFAGLRMHREKTELSQQEPEVA
jgi:hypothetical protein